jgi:hypothetical protein
MFMAITFSSENVVSDTIEASISNTSDEYSIFMEISVERGGKHNTESVFLSPDDAIMLGRRLIDMGLSIKCQD